MTPEKPEDWPRQFEQHVNAGELDAALGLYDPEAHFVSPGDGALAGVSDRFVGVTPRRSCPVA
jgi:hypothetical protein